MTEQWSPGALDSVWNTCNYEVALIHLKWLMTFSMHNLKVKHMNEVCNMLWILHSGPRPLEAFFLLTQGSTGCSNFSISFKHTLRIHIKVYTILDTTIYNGKTTQCEDQPSAPICLLLWVVCDNYIGNYRPRLLVMRGTRWVLWGRIYRTVRDDGL